MQGMRTLHPLRSLYRSATGKLILYICSPCRVNMATCDEIPEKLSKIYRYIDELKARASKDPDHVERVLSSALKEMEATLEELSQPNKELVEAGEENQRLLTAIQEERDKLSAKVNSIGDEVWFADTQKRFTSANPSALREFDLSSDDITDYKRMEKERTHLASFPQLNPNPVVEVDPEGCVHYLNNAAQKLFPDLQ